MATTAPQLAANRANALLSTGPSTAEGKLASSRNAVSHGLTSADALLPIEDPDEYALHHQSRIDHYRPRNPIAHSLVTELADLEWRLRRVPAFEAQLLSAECRRITSDPELAPLAKILKSEAQVLAVAFTRLVESKVLPNLLNQESRLSRRAEKIRRHLESFALQPPPARRPAPTIVEPQPASGQLEIEEANIENPENEPNQPIRVPAKIGRNEPCPCRSGLKFKRCCLNKTPAAAVSSA